MKNIALALLFATTAVLFGCKTSPTTPSTAHILTSVACESVTASFGDKEYSLTPTDAPMGVACYNPVQPEDVGKDLPATLDSARGVLTITTDFGPVPYKIDAARESR